MSRFKIISIFLALTIILFSARPALAKTSHDELESFFDSYLTEQMQTHHIPGAVVSVVKDGAVVFAKGYGYADIEKQTLFDENTLLTVASLGKAFTAVGVLQLSERGMIDLHADIRPYFKNFNLNTNFDSPLTFANLLTHTDGFETRLIGIATLKEDELKPLGELLATYKPNQVLPAGKYMTYGDYAANLSGYLTQEISGVPFEQYMDDHILLPLGMTNSTFDQHLSQAMKDKLATAYEYQNGEYEPQSLIYVSYAPQGGLRTTAVDMNQFMLALLNGGRYHGGRIMRPETVESMFTQQFTGQVDMPGITYGLFEDYHKGQRILLRDGDGIGTRTRMILIPDLNTGIFISYNSGDSNLRLNLAGAYLDQFYPSDESVSIPMAGYQERAALFAGTYRPLQADVSTFTKSMYFFSQQVDVTSNPDGTLTIEANGMGEHSSVMGGFEGATQWVETSPLHFVRVDGNGVVAFIQDENGDITQMISGQGYHSTFAKLKFYESQGFQIIFVGLAVMIILIFGLVIFLFMPIGALVSKFRKQTTQPRPGVTTAALVWGGVITQWLLMSVFQTIGVLYAINSVAGLPNFIWGISPEIINALNGVFLPVIISLSLPILAILSWAKSWWKPGMRILYSAVSLAAIMFIWWAHYWNLIGFHL